MAIRLITSHMVHNGLRERFKDGSKSPTNGVISSELQHRHLATLVSSSTSSSSSSSSSPLSCGFDAASNHGRMSGSSTIAFRELKIAENRQWCSDSRNTSTGAFFTQRFAMRGGLNTAASSDVAASSTTIQVLQSKLPIEKLSEVLTSASPLEIMENALSCFGKDISIAFSGAEDVALIEYARLTGRPFRVFSLDTGRLNPETYRFFKAVEKHYGIRIEYTFPDAAEVEALVRQKGLFSFYEDGHQECCSIRKVQPLKKMLQGLNAWITGQRQDQSPGTRSNVPVIQLDPSFEGLRGGTGSLVKWNPLAKVSSAEVWNFLRTMDAPVNALHSQGFVSIGCEPCTRPVLPGQHEREGRWWWEDATAKECGLHKGNLTNIDSAGTDNLKGAHVEEVDLFTNKNIIAFNRADIEKLVASDKRDKSAIVVLYAPWCQFSQAMESAYNELAEHLKGDILVGKFRADAENKAYAQSELQLKTFPTILYFSRYIKKAIKYPSERRDVASLLAFAKAVK